jgi:hypothetical protein
VAIYLSAIFIFVELHDYGALGYHRKELVKIANFPKELQSFPIPLPLVDVDDLLVPSASEIILQCREECK